MASDFQKAVAIEVLGNLYDLILARTRDTKNTGFSNTNVMSIIKRWDKIGMELRGESYHKQVALYHSDGALTATTSKRSKVMLDALGTFLSQLSNNGTTEGQFFNAAEKSVREFVWEYRKRIKGSTDLKTSEAAFKKALMDWQSLSAADAMQDKEVMTGMEQHA